MSLQQKIARTRQLAEQASSNIQAFRASPFGGDNMRDWADIRDLLTEYANVLQRELERAEPEYLEIPRFLRKHSD